MPGEVLQGIDRYRAGQLDSSVDEVHRAGANRGQSVPTRPGPQHFEGDLSAAHHQQRLRRTGDHGFHADVWPLLLDVACDGVAARDLDDVADEGALADGDNRVVRHGEEDADDGLSSRTVPDSIDSVLQPQDKSGSLALASGCRA